MHHVRHNIVLTKYGESMKTRYTFITRYMLPQGMGITLAYRGARELHKA